MGSAGRPLLSAPCPGSAGPSPRPTPCSAAASKPIPPVHPHVCLRMSPAPSWTADVRSLSAGGSGQGHGLGALPTSGSGLGACVFLCCLDVGIWASTVTLKGAKERQTLQRVPSSALSSAPVEGGGSWGPCRVGWRTPVSAIARRGEPAGSPAQPVGALGVTPPVRDHLPSERLGAAGQLFAEGAGFRLLNDKGCYLQALRSGGQEHSLWRGPPGLSPSSAFPGSVTVAQCFLSLSALGVLSCIKWRQ